MKVKFEKRKETESCLDVAMSGYDRAEIWKLIRIYILTCLATIPNKSDCKLYRDECLLIPCQINGQ